MIGKQIIILNMADVKSAIEQYLQPEFKHKLIVHDCAPNGNSGLSIDIEVKDLTPKANVVTLVEEKVNSEVNHIVTETCRLHGIWYHLDTASTARCPKCVRGVW